MTQDRRTVAEKPFGIRASMGEAGHHGADQGLRLWPCRTGDKAARDTAHQVTPLDADEPREQNHSH